MKYINHFLKNIPIWLSSKTSIFIYLFLFGYLVIFALICYIFPTLHNYAPSQDTQLILGNYTNVLSALGASIAAGSGVAIHRRIKTIHENHEKLQKTIEDLNHKMNKLSEYEKEK